jgi:hypothetical protein
VDGCFCSCDGSHRAHSSTPSKGAGGLGNSSALGEICLKSAV